MNQETFWEKFRRIFFLFAGVVCLTSIVHSAYQGKQLAAVYDLPPDALAAQLGESKVWYSRGHSMDNHCSGIFWGLNGAADGGQLVLDSDSQYQLSVKGRSGQCRAALQDSHHADLILLEAGEAVAIPQGIYQVYYIGKGFWGNAEISRYLPNA